MVFVYFHVGFTHEFSWGAKRLMNFAKIWVNLSILTVYVKNLSKFPKIDENFPAIDQKDESVSDLIQN